MQSESCYLPPTAPSPFDWNAIPGQLPGFTGTSGGGGGGGGGANPVPSHAFRVAVPLSTVQAIEVPGWLWPGAPDGSFAGGPHELSLAGRGATTSH